MQPTIEAFLDPATSTISYIVFDEPGGTCAIIDPVLDYDCRSGRTSAMSLEKLLAFVKSQRLTVEWILETHVHADHLSSAYDLKSRVGGKTGVGRDIPHVQRIFKEIFNLGPDFIPDGRHFDALLGDGETFSVGNLTAKAISTPGHTPADLSYQFGDAIFVGDTLFMPDLGTARADFPGGRCAAIIPIDSQAAQAAARNKIVHVPRLPASKPPALLGNNCRRATRAQHPRAGRYIRRGVCGHAGSSRRYARYACPVVSIRPGERAGGRNTAKRREWSFVSENTFKPDLTLTRSRLFEYVDSRPSARLLNQGVTCGLMVRPYHLLTRLPLHFG